VTTPTQELPPLPTPDAPAPSAPAPLEPLPTGWQVPRLLLILAIPIIASMISRTVMSFVDFIFVSRLGTDAQAAIMPAGIFTFALIAFGMGVITAVNTFVSQNHGAGRPRECSAYAWQGLYVSAIFAALLLPVWFLIPPLFRFVGHAAHVQQMEISFAQISILSIFPAIATMALADFFNGIHKPSIGLWSSIIANIFNALANYVLIYGKLGLPAMGIAGSALGTLLATLLQTAVLFIWILLPKYRAAYHTAETWPFSARRCLDLIRVGTPAGIQFVSDIFCFTVFTLFIVGGFGTAQLAANNLVFKFLEMSFMPTVGLSVALTAAVGKAIGMGRKDHARLVTRWALAFAMTYMGSIALLYILIPHHLAALLSPDPNVQYWAARVLTLCALFQLFDAAGITHVGALRGAGDNWIQAIISVTFGFTIFLPGGFLLAHYAPSLGILGPWLAATAFIMLVCTSLLLRWKFGPWEKINLLQSPRDSPGFPLDSTPTSAS
jgi:multidrug resistance protein, MATE family